MDNKIKNNKYDRLIVLMLALQAFGGLGDALQPIRLFIIISVPFLLYYFLKKGNLRECYRYERLFFLVWWIYAFVSILWVIVPEESIKDTLYLAVNFLGFFVLILLASKASNPQKSIIKGWILLFVLTLPVALYELWFDIHLPMSVQESDFTMNFGNEVMERRFASVTYGNLNGYNTILCYIFPFICLNLFRLKSKSKLILNWILLFIISYIIISNSSRGAILCLAVGLVLFGLYYLNNAKSLVILFIVLAIAFYFATAYFDEVFGVIVARFEDQGLEDVGRLDNLVCGFDALLKSGFMGIGAGNYIPTMTQIYGLEIAAPHNIFLEIGVQYGVIILLLFLWMLVRIFKLGKQNERNNKIFIVVSLCIFPLTSIINSGYLLSIYVWMLIGSMYIIADKKYNN